MDKRQQPRFIAQFRSTFSGGQREGQGRTLDLSAGGCKVEADLPVFVGASFECRIYIPGLDWPLRIDEAQVRWVKDNTFGIQFKRFSLMRRQNLRKSLPASTKNLRRSFSRSSIFL